MSDLRSEWRNDSDGIVGVTIYNEDGKRTGIALKPGEAIWMTQADRVATANAPKNPVHNPLANGWLTCITPASEVINRRPIGEEAQASPDQPDDGLVEVKLNGVPVRMTRESAEALQAARQAPEGTPPREERPVQDDERPPALQGAPEEGVRAPGEEVATPEAVAQSGTAKRSGRGVTVKTAPPEGMEKPEPKPGTPTGVVVGAGGAQYAEAK